VFYDWSVGRVTKGEEEALLRHVSRSTTDAALPDLSRRNPQPVLWDWIDIGADDQTLRIEFLEGVVHGLHHIEIDEDDENIQVTVFVGVDPDFHGGGYVLVGFARWAMAKTDRPVAGRRISDGFEEQTESG
jgi:hypothetical protein